MHKLDSLPPAQKTVSARQQVLDAAAAAVLQDRNASYGPPENNFQDIAAVWNWYLGNRATSEHVKNGIVAALDVANMMILMKMARLKYNPNHRDSKVDVAGYAACAAECEARPVIQTLNPTEGEKSPLEIITEMQNLFQQFPVTSTK